MFILAAVSELVLAEARVNIIEKFSESDLLRFYHQLAATRAVIVNPPSPETLERCFSVVGQKDAHVLGAALGCSASYLLTLDRRRLITPMTTSLSVTIMAPGDFLKRILYSPSGDFNPSP